MLLVENEGKKFNPEEINRGTLIWAKHMSWPEGQTGIVTAALENQIRVQYLPDVHNVLNHFFINVDEVEGEEWEIRYSSDGLETVTSYPEE